MRLHRTLVFFLLLVPTLAQAYELVTIQAVSSTRRSFLTRNGIRQGVMQGMTGTFTAEDVSIIARAIQVSGEFTQWEIVNPNTTLPFEKGSIVTWSTAKEYLWALAPEKERQKYIKSLITIPKNSVIFKGALSRGLNESVSGAPATDVRRGGYMGELYYEKFLTPAISFDVGYRFEREVINYSGLTYTTTRNMLITNLLYYIDAFKELLNDGRPFVGVGAGYGFSRTTTDALSQSGPVGLLPGIKAGLSLPFNEEWEFIVDVAFETLQTKEEQDTGLEQTTTQTNLKGGFGLRKFF